MRALTTLLALAWAGCAAANDVVVGRPAPPITLHALDGASLASDGQTGKVVILTFWATWCVPCRTELPLLSDYAARHADQGLEILALVRERFGIPVLTDVHLPDQCGPAAEAVDILQIPAFLCRQTDLLLAAGQTGRAINVKKGQFLAPWDMTNVAAKIASTGNENILLCERGVSFGYNTLVTDFRALPIMARTGYPVVFDATHSVQQPGGQGTSSGGQREFAPVLSRAAVAIGVAAVFIETHPDPDRAPSDGPNMIPLREMPMLLQTLAGFDRLAKPVTHP